LATNSTNSCKYVDTANETNVQCSATAYHQFEILLFS